MKMKDPSKHSKHVIEEEEETESRSPSDSDFQASTTLNFQTPIIHSQLRVLNKAFIIDMVALFDEFKSTKNKEKRKSYHATFEQKEKDYVKRKWKEKMHELQKHILFFDFIENYYISKNISKNSLDMVKKKSNFVKEDKTVVQSSHSLPYSISHIWTCQNPIFHIEFREYDSIT